jgi:prevent-host-death family protein
VTVETGIRELRENLRAFLERVKNGDTVLVTERGRPVARIVRAEADEAYERLVLEGVITPAVRPKRPIEFEGLPRLRGRPTLSDIVIERRRSRDY